jgi:hypothetical protein
MSGLDPIFLQRGRLLAAVHGFEFAAGVAAARSIERSKT